MKFKAVRDVWSNLLKGAPRYGPIGLVCWCYLADHSYCDQEGRGEKWSLYWSNMCTQKTLLRLEDAVQGVLPLKCFLQDSSLKVWVKGEIHRDSISKGSVGTAKPSWGVTEGESASQKRMKKERKEKSLNASALWILWAANFLYKMYVCVLSD